MRLFLVAAVAASAVVAAPVVAAKTYPSCHVHKSRDVSFRNALSKDVLDVSIGTGPCYAATLTIVVRSNLGEVLYSYVAPFKRHVALNWESPDLDKYAFGLVNEIIANGVGSSRDLPPWLESSEYADENSGEIKVSKAFYEQLRAKPRPMLDHPNHYEGWRYVVFDEAKDEAVIVVMGGV